jgi:N,N'-diacetylchitobiose transport system permease protein
MLASRGKTAPSPVEARRPQRSLAPLALLAPAFIMLAVFIGWPVIQLTIMSFQKYGREQIFGKPAEFWTVLGRSVVFAAVCVVLTMVLGMVIAVLMTRLGAVMRTVVSVGLLLAWSMPALTATIVWGWIFDTSYGLVNHLLTRITGDSWMGHSWLVDPLSFFTVAGIIIVWGAIPFVALSIYAALTQVPTEVLEAASLDGASGLRRFWNVTMPFIRSILVVLLILQIIWDLRVFAQIYALQTIGGVRETTNTIGVYIYNESMASGKLGTGGAISIILVAIMLAISAYYIRLTLKQEDQ